MRTLALMIIGVTLAWPAWGQVPCGDRKSIVTQLAEGYLEESRGRGLTNNGTILEIFASPGGETFSVVLSAPDGQSCLIAAGESWQQVAPKPKGRGL